MLLGENNDVQPIDRSELKGLIEQRDVFVQVQGVDTITGTQTSAQREKLNYFNRKKKREKK